MKATTAALLALLALFATGCWDRLELNDWGFVQSAAIDLTEDGRIRLTTLVYKPGGMSDQSMDPSQGGTFIDVSGTDGTVYGASLQTSGMLGRRLQWSQLDTLLIGEQVARSRNIADVLDFFSRSNEPKNAFPVIITKGEARQYLRSQPVLDNSIGRQLGDNVQQAREVNSTTLPVTLTELTVLAKEPFSVYVLPYIAQDDNNPGMVRTTMTLLRFPEGRIGSVVPSRLAPFLLMLMDKYRYGLLELPCEDKSGAGRYDTFRILRTHTAVKPVTDGDKLRLRIDVRVDGDAKELMCCSLMSQSDIDRFNSRVEQTLREQLTETMDFLQRQQADVIGAGTRLHRWHNGLWKRWKGDWPRRFAAADVEFRIRITLVNTGVDTGRPLASSERDAMQ